MASSNSETLQSSSGGYEESNSKADTTSSFLNVSTGNLSYFSHSQRSYAEEKFSESSTNSNPFVNQNPLWQINNSQNPSISASITQACRSIFPSSATITDPTSKTNKTRKRSRASRKPPITVLATDATNFRDMVQKFTGITAPPFSEKISSQSRIEFLSNKMMTPPTESYLLQGFTQKFQSLSGSSLSAAPFSNGNFQIGFEHQNLANLQNLQNTTGNFNSSSKPSDRSKYPLTFLPLLHHESDWFPQNPNTSYSHVTINELQDATGLNQLSSQELLLKNDNTPTRMDREEPFRIFNGDYSNPERINGCNMNFAASSSDFLLDKRSEISDISKNEGMIDSWLYSSD